MPIRSTWLCLDLSSSGARVAFGRGGRPGEVSDVPVGKLGGSPAEVLAAVGPGIEEAAVRLRALREMPPADGVLAALPDAWFRVGLVRRDRAVSRGRARDYFRWKATVDWGLPTDETVYDWQPTAPPWVREAPFLLAAAAPETARAIELPIAGLPVLLAVPRCIAAWNAGVASAMGAEAFVLADGNAFALFGTVGGRLRYFRSRACADGSERDAEAAETVRHFGETIGRGVEVRALGHGAPVAGLVRHPLASGIFA